MSVFSRRKGVFIGGGLILLAVIILVSARGKGTPTYETTRAGRTTIVEEVSATGRVEPAETIELAFEVGGRVAAVPVKVGSRVTRGTVLASLESADSAANVRREEARVATAEATLAQLEAVRASKQAGLDEKLRGSRPEELEIARVKVENAEIALADTKSKLFATMRDGVTKVDDALYNKADQLFSNPSSSQPQFNFQLANSQLEIDIENGRYARGQALASWRSTVESLGAIFSSASCATLRRFRYS